MAAGVLSNVVGDIITNLGSLALDEIGLWWGVKGELEKLKDTVSSIRNVLLDAEEQQKLNHQVTGWLERLEEVVYDADDLIDDFATEALRRRVMTGNRMTKEVCLFFSSSNQLVYGFKMGHKIKAIRERLADIQGDREFKLEVRTDQERTVERDQTESSLPEVFIGREGDKKAITELVLSSNGEECVSVLSIVGIGGLGKTTLAQFIFNDELIKNSFELRIWVCVSDPFDVKMIVRKILESATGNKSEDLELEALKSQLGEIIDRKKYLLVLDDVWNENSEKWQKLKRLLVGGSSGSKILITTRSKKVANISSTMAPHVLEGLSPDESWSLFLRVALKGQVPNNANVREIGEEILKKCCGVPLAIKTIASLLYDKNPETEWMLFLRNELSQISQDDNDIIPTLKLSYNHLPSHLKHCFAYCALYPKDYVIDVKILIHLWVAQGFIEAPITSEMTSDHLEDIGREYFMKLWRRSFFQEVERDDSGNVICCQMHDLMHDLATTVSGTRIQLVNSDAQNIDEKTHHIAFHLNVALQKILINAKRPRSFLLFEKHDCKELFIHKNLRCLRAYHMRNCGSGNGFEKVDSCIKMLKHLRYLDVSENVKLRALPNSITDLLNLQVLNVSYCFKLEELPKDIKKLVNLRHLYCEACYSLTHMPRGLGQLTSLQTLSKFVVAKGNISSKDVGKINELNKLKNLRGRLEIKNLECVDNEIVNVNLKEKPLLQALELHWELSWDDSNVDREVMAFQNLQPHPNLKELNVYGYGGRRFPSWFSTLTSLRSLRFSDCPQLKERCGNKKGADWEFISHIQNIKVNEQTIQEEGRYLLDDEASISEG